MISKYWIISKKFHINLESIFLVITPLLFILALASDFQIHPIGYFLGMMIITAFLYYLSDKAIAEDAIPILEKKIAKYKNRGALKEQVEEWKDLLARNKAKVKSFF
jgi:hypothetical protein